MQNYPLISVIIVNYNTAKLVEQLIFSLKRTGYPSLEIIVIDNNSPDGAPTRLTEQFLNVKLIKSPQNLGFAGGNNLGIDQAKGDYLLFLNPDTEVATSSIYHLLDKLEKHPNIGLVSPKIKYNQAPQRIQYAGTSRMHPVTLQTHSFGYHCLDKGQYDESRKTAFGHGAAMMIPRRVVDKVGKMNERYFLYYEELDWCERIRKIGYQIYYVAEAVVWHKGSAAVQKNNPLKTYYMTRNRLLFARLHFKRWVWFGLYTCLVSIPKNTLVYLFSWKHLRAYWKGISWHLQNRKINQPQ